MMLCLLAIEVSGQDGRGKSSHESNMLNHLDVGVNVGTTGLGLNIAMPVSDWVRVRAGFSYMPRFNVPLTFHIASYAEGSGVQSINEKFATMQAVLKQFSGMTVDETVSMNTKCTMVDFNFMVDVYPLKNDRRWRVTAGFLWGRSKIGHAENTIKDMSSLVSLNFYNRLYDYFTQRRFLSEPLYGDMYIDPDMGFALKSKFESYGRLGIHLGEFNDGVVLDGKDVSGQPYMMEPNEDGMVIADMFVDNFKPYIGLGYDTEVGRGGKFRFGVDAGVVFWGGRPDLITHPNTNYGNESVDMINDLHSIGGKVGDYVDITKAFVVYPNIGVHLAYRIF